MNKFKPTFFLIFLTFASPYTSAQANVCSSLFIKGMHAIKGDKSALPAPNFLPEILWFGNLDHLDSLGETLSLESDSARAKYEWSVRLDPEVLADKLQYIEESVVYSRNEDFAPIYDDRHQQIEASILDSIKSSTSPTASVHVKISPHMHLYFPSIYQIPTLTVDDITPYEASLISSIIGDQPRLTTSTTIIQLNDYAFDRIYFGYLMLAKDTQLNKRRIQGIDHIKALEEVHIKSKAVAMIYTSKILPIASLDRSVGRLPLKMLFRIAQFRENSDLSNLSALLLLVDSLPGSKTKKNNFKKIIARVWNNLAQNGGDDLSMGYSIRHRLRFKNGVTVHVSGLLHMQLRILQQSRELEIIDSFTDSDLIFNIGPETRWPKNRPSLLQQIALEQRLRSI